MKPSISQNPGLVQLLPQGRVQDDLFHSVKEEIEADPIFISPGKPVTHESAKKTIIKKNKKTMRMLASLHHQTKISVLNCYCTS